MDETTEATEPKMEQLTFADIASLAIATVIYLGRDDKEIIDNIGAVADKVKAEMLQEKQGDDEPEPS